MSRAHSYSHSRAHSPTFPPLHLCHNSFSNPSIALSTSQLILQPLRCFTYVTAHSPTLLSLLLRHKLFIQFTGRAAHVKHCLKLVCGVAYRINTNSAPLISLYCRLECLRQPTNVKIIFYMNNAKSANSVPSSSLIYSHGRLAR